MTKPKKKKKSNRLDTKLINFKNIINLIGISPNIINYILTPKKKYNKNIPIFIVGAGFWGPGPTSKYFWSKSPQTINL